MASGFLPNVVLVWEELNVTALIQGNLLLDCLQILKMAQASSPETLVSYYKKTQAKKPKALKQHFLR